MEEVRDTVFRSRPISIIRNENLKLLLFHEECILHGGSSKIETNNPVELYNLKPEMSERINLINKEPLVGNELLYDLLDWMKETGAPIPVQRNSDYHYSK